MPELKGLGFSLEYESETTWRVTAVPAFIRQSDASDLIYRILDSVTMDSANYGKEGDMGDSLRQRLALVMARSSAIRRGKRLSVAEMEDIVASLFALPDPGLTPNGSRIFTTLDEERLNPLFAV